ncbi:hypothetical protein [Salmonella sp. s58078]|uniref:hypothetical protein n=1 Tax=Salmonella sp. s58078 TaxID=3159699 RepID=UPI00397F20CC
MASLKAEKPAGSQIPVGQTKKEPTVKAPTPKKTAEPKKKTSSTKLAAKKK